MNLEETLFIDKCNGKFRGSFEDFLFMDWLHKDNPDVGGDIMQNRMDLWRRSRILEGEMRIWNTNCQARKQQAVSPCYRIDRKNEPGLTEIATISKQTWDSSLEETPPQSLLTISKAD